MNIRAAHEVKYLETLIARLGQLRTFLLEREVPSHETSLAEWHAFLAGMKQITGNASQQMSFIATLMAKDYLCSSLPMKEFDVGLKPQGAKGLDIDAETVDGRRVISEVKTTTPYGVDLGGQQKDSFRSDFQKLNEAAADLKYFFVTDATTFNLVCNKYRNQIPEVHVVMLPNGECAPPLRLNRK